MIGYETSIQKFLEHEEKITLLAERATPYEARRLVDYTKALFSMCPLKSGDKTKIVNPMEISSKVSWGLSSDQAHHARRA